METDGARALHDFLTFTQHPSLSADTVCIVYNAVVKNVSPRLSRCVTHCLVTLASNLTSLDLVPWSNEADSIYTTQCY